MKKIFLIGLCILFGVTSQAQNTIDLSGEWEFSIDRNDVGEQEKWFASTLDDRINLPGSMPETAGMLFEAKVLNGKLMMTSMDLSTDLDERIVARQMRKAILDYMNSDRFRPQFEVSPQQINGLFQKTAGEVDMYTRQSPDELKPTIK